MPVLRNALMTLTSCFPTAASTTSLATYVRAYLQVLILQCSFCVKCVAISKVR